MSVVFSIKLCDVLHRFLYNRIKQYYTYRTNPTIYLRYCLEHCCELSTTRKRKAKDQLGDLCKDILCIVNKKVRETEQDISCRLADFVLVRSNVSLLQVNTAHTVITITHRLLHKLYSENANCFLLKHSWFFLKGFWFGFF